MRNVYKYILFLGYWLLAIGSINAQNNLIMNPSFEQLEGCPNNFTQADTAKYWGWVNSTTILPAQIAYDCRGTLISSCCTSSSYCSEPYNWFGYQKPRTGNSYICLVSIDAISPPNNNKREYLKGQLSSTLTTGKSYCLTFYYSAANTIIYSTNRFGAYIDNNAVASYSCCSNMPVTPQAQNNPAVFMTDTLNWVKIQNSFTAIGNENTITLGNFVDSATIQFQMFNSNGVHAPYYLIDDVSLLPVDLAPYAGNDTNIVQGDSAYIGRPFEIGLNDDCTWYVLGNTTAIDTIAGKWVKPTTTTSYIVEQNICGTITYDTVKVSVNPLGIKQYASSNNQLLVYPNPANNILNIACNIENADITIMDVLGNIVIQQKVQSKIVSIDISSLDKGVYFIKSYNNNNRYTVKLIKE